MAYAPQTWTDDVTPADAAHMNFIEAGLDAAADVADAAVPKSVVDAVGDLIVGSGADAVTRLAKGTNGHWLRTVGGALVWESFDLADIPMVGAAEGEVLTSIGGVASWEALPAWQSYTPTWTASGTAPVLGNGAITARYTQIGKTVHARGSIVMGSTTTYGTGNYYLTLPVTAQAVANSGGIMGLCVDLSVGTFAPTFAFLDTTARMAFFWVRSDGENFLSHDSPWVWANTDVLRWQITYEAA